MDLKRCFRSRAGGATSAHRRRTGVGMMRKAGVVALMMAAVAAAQTVAGPEAQSEATVRGKVVDEGGSPVAGATVRIAGREASAVTGPDGTYELSGLAPGTVTVRAEAEGYFPAEVGELALEAGEAVELTLELEAKPVVTETLVVTATGTEYELADAPVRTELVTTERVDREIKTTLAEALTATVPGIRIEMNCQNCGVPELRMNGLEGPYTQVLEDGLPDYSGVAAVYGLEQIPTQFIEQIEVVKGGNSALYGPGAVAGVVNLIRREPTENRFRLDLLGGWHHGRPEQQLGASAQVKSLPGSFSGDFYYRGINRVPIDRDGDGFSDAPKRRLNAGGFGLYRGALGGKARLSVNMTSADEFRRGGERFDLPPHETRLTEQIASRRTAVAVRWNHTVSAATYYHVKTSFADTRQDSYFGSNYDPNAYGTTRNPLWVSDAQIGHQAGRHTILGGY
ncbi:MAG TPA: hypothetical protein ENJ62_02900, partial [Bryobacterales bacterium]|nr:hypothetical protein [Bryobacterales bacterium]